MLPSPWKRTHPNGERERAVRREGRVASTWRGFRRRTDRYRLLTDVVGGILLVAIVVGGLAAATGGVWPPVVVVESGSMMHATQDTPYGRFGTIDVGDLVFVRAVDGPEDVQTWAEGGELHYRRPGDVLAYAPNGDRTNTTVIHRAIAYVEVAGLGRETTYSLRWVDGDVLTWDKRGIYFPPLGFDEAWGFSPAQGFRPAYSGYLTKGDNAFSNPAVDQAMGVSKVVDPAWIVGEVYGEVPWMGLAKLALTSGQTNPAVPGWERVGNAFAPLELWTMFFVALAALLLVPLAIDTWRAWRRYRLEQEHERRIEEESRRRMEERRRAEAAQPKRIATFAAIVAPRPATPTAQVPPPARPPPKSG